MVFLYATHGVPLSLVNPVCYPHKSGFVGTKQVIEVGI